ncbi:hypothetical protein JTE88_06480 [Arcanobacterium phocisimile]|uniref:Uncharacterized protein n=1 Tax=Arcanobacterium phocisimile TaxID=1302235 RepID=A0ABX7IFY2_9ACTO|nr:hypothetical protein [Arcanobacterium phocisimile]QRV01737.1 hypothetical protein JTE88_06480 [Arcanobacterium phocisimile]
MHTNFAITTAKRYARRPLVSATLTDAHWEDDERATLLNMLIFTAGVAPILVPMAAVSMYSSETPLLFILATCVTVLATGVLTYWGSRHYARRLWARGPVDTAASK